MEKDKIYKIDNLTGLISKKIKGEKISPADWLKANVDNLLRYRIVTHVGKCMASNAQAAIWDSSESSDMGYLTTASVGKRQDIVVNGGARYSSLSFILIQRLRNGKTVLENFQENTDLIREEVEALDIDYEELREKILAIQKPTSCRESYPSLRQVYFPVGEEGYHLLTVLPSTTMGKAMQENVAARRQEARKNRNEKESYTSLSNLTKFHFGGTNAQNVSAFNAGASLYMLPSAPPYFSLKRLPRHDFFTESIPWRWKKELIQSMYQLIYIETDRSKAEQEIEFVGQEIAGKIMLIAFNMREIMPGWSDREEHVDMPRAQRLWLDAKYTEQRLMDETWIEEVSLFFGRWVNDSYTMMLKWKKKTRDHVDILLQHFAEILKELLQEEVKNEIDG